MDRDQLVSLLTSREDMWKQRNVRALTATYTENATILSPMFAAVHGRPAIEKTFRDIFAVFPDMELVAEELVIDGDRAAQAFRSVATHAQDFFGISATHRRFDVQGVFLYRFEGGLICNERRIYDFTSLLIQVGVLKARPG